MEAWSSMKNKLPRESAAVIHPRLDGIGDSLLACCQDCVQYRSFRNDASDCGNQLCSVHRSYNALLVLQDEAERPTRSIGTDVLKKLLSMAKEPA